MKKQKKDLLVTLADENYVEQAKQLFSSVYWNAGWEGNYMLLVHEISEKKLRWFRNKGILVKKCKSIVKKSKSPKSAMLLKFYMFTPEFKKWGNIVYLDTDIIVRTSLDALTHINAFAAVSDMRDIKNQFMKSKLKNSKLREYLKNYDLKREAFNAGVMAFSTDIIDKTTSLKLKKLYKQYISSIRPSLFDQPIFNLLFYRKWKKLLLLYNFNPFLDKSLYPRWIKKPMVNGIILHLYGSKPWNQENHFYEEWKNNLDKAELINLKKIQPCRKLTKKEIRRYELYLNLRIIVCEILFFIDKTLGFIGLFLKKHIQNYISS